MLEKRWDFGAVLLKNKIYIFGGQQEGMRKFQSLDANAYCILSEVTR